MVIATCTALLVATSSTTTAVIGGSVVVAELVKKKESLDELTVEPDSELFSAIQVSLANRTACLVWKGAMWCKCSVVLHGDLMVITPSRFFPEAALILSDAFISQERSTVTVACEADGQRIYLRFREVQDAVAWTAKAREAAALSSNFHASADLIQHRQRLSMRTRSRSTTPREHSRPGSHVGSRQPSMVLYEAPIEGDLIYGDDSEDEEDDEVSPLDTERQLREELKVPKRVKMVMMTPRREVWPELHPVPRIPSLRHTEEEITLPEHTFASKVFRTLGLSPPTRRSEVEGESRVAVLQTRFQS